MTASGKTTHHCFLRLQSTAPYCVMQSVFVSHSLYHRLIIANDIPRLERKASWTNTCSFSDTYSNLYVQAHFAWENRHRQVFVCKKYKGANLTYQKTKQKQEQSPYHNKLCWEQRHMRGRHEEGNEWENHARGVRDKERERGSVREALSY